MLQAAGIEQTIVPGSSALDALVPLDRVEWVAGLDEVAGVGLMNLTVPVGRASPREIPRLRDAMTMTDGSIRIPESRPATVTPAVPVVSSQQTEGAVEGGLVNLRAWGRKAQVPAALRADLRGQGLTIAVIDHFDPEEVEGLQEDGEWPASERLTLRGFGTTDAQRPGWDDHGMAVLEIVYDIAPDAAYRAYHVGRNSGVSWEQAIQDAANLSADNRPLGPPRADVITASLGRVVTVDAPGDGTGGGGGSQGLYSAIEAAAANGVTIFNAAGNEGSQHAPSVYNYWSGEGTGGAGANTVQRFGQPGREGTIFNDDSVLLLGLGSANAARAAGRELDDVQQWCAVVGLGNNPLFDFGVALSWNDWATQNNVVDIDYKLEVMVWVDRKVVNRVVVPAHWEVAATQDAQQNGRPGQLPLESIVLALSKEPARSRAQLSTSECAGVYGALPASIFGVRITRKTQTNANQYVRIQSVEQTGSYMQLGRGQKARSIGVPADSPHVISVGAIDVLTKKIEPYSSQGPILLPGGTGPDDSVNRIKPDIASFANVRTVSSPGFNGTSAATPHAAAFGLLALQHQKQLTASTASEATTEAQLRARRVALSGMVRDTLSGVASNYFNDLNRNGPVEIRPDVGYTLATAYNPDGRDTLFGFGYTNFRSESANCALDVGYKRAYLPYRFTEAEIGRDPYAQFATLLAGMCSNDGFAWQYPLNWPTAR
jgi:hypothetical protein